MNFSPTINHLRIVPKLDKLIIGVCTYRRPQMLARCLKSIAAQKYLDDYSVSVVVVDNDNEPSARPVYDEADRTYPLAIRYIHHPIRGIPQARNAILEFAKKECADWLVFIDDDETARMDCVANLMDPKLKLIPIVYGDTRQDVPSVQCRWKLDKTRTLSDPAMSNVRFDSRVIQSGIEFDCTLALTGGEDDAFFREATKRRLHIAKTAGAVTYSEVHPGRFTFRRQMGKAFSDAALKQREVNWLRSPFGAVWEGSKSAAFLLVSGIAQIATLAVNFWHPGWAPKRLLGGCMDISEAAGHIAALFGRLPEPYRTVDGH